MPVSVFWARSSTPVLHSPLATERSRKSDVLVRLVQHQPAAAGALGRADELALLRAPVGLAQDVPALQIRAFKGPIGDKGRRRGGNQRGRQKRGRRRYSTRKFFRHGLILFLIRSVFSIPTGNKRPRSFRPGASPIQTCALSTNSRSSPRNSRTCSNCRCASSSTRIRAQRRIFHRHRERQPSLRIRLGRLQFAANLRRLRIAAYSGPRNFTPSQRKM